VEEPSTASNSEVTALPRYFRFAPNIRHQLGVSALVPADYEPCCRAKPRLGQCRRLDH
jgi:hypothetical protein